MRPEHGKGAVQGGVGQEKTRHHQSKAQHWPYGGPRYAAQEGEANGSEEALAQWHDKQRFWESKRYQEGAGDDSKAGSTRVQDLVAPVSGPRASLHYQINTNKGYKPGTSAMAAAQGLAPGGPKLKSMAVEAISRTMIKIMLDAMLAVVGRYLVYESTKPGVVIRRAPSGKAHDWSYRVGEGVPVPGGSAMPSGSPENAVQLKLLSGSDVPNRLEEGISKEVLKKALQEAGWEPEYLDFVEQEGLHFIADCFSASLDGRASIQSIEGKFEVLMDRHQRRWPWRACPGPGPGPGPACHRLR